MCNDTLFVLPGLAKALSRIRDLEDCVTTLTAAQKHSAQPKPASPPVSCAPTAEVTASVATQTSSSASLLTPDLEPALQPVVQCLVEPDTPLARLHHQTSRSAFSVPRVISCDGAAASPSAALKPIAAPKDSCFSEGNGVSSTACFIAPDTPLARSHRAVASLASTSPIFMGSKDSAASPPMAPVTTAFESSLSLAAAAVSSNADDAIPSATPLSPTVSLSAEVDAEAIPSGSLPVVMTSPISPVASVQPGGANSPSSSSAAGAADNASCKASAVRQLFTGETTIQRKQTAVQPDLSITSGKSHPTADMRKSLAGDAAVAPTGSSLPTCEAAAQGSLPHATQAKTPAQRLSSASDPRLAQARKTAPAASASPRIQFYALPAPDGNAFGLTGGQSSCNSDPGAEGSAASGRQGQTAAAPSIFAPGSAVKSLRSGAWRIAVSVAKKVVPKVFLDRAQYSAVTAALTAEVCQLINMLGEVQRQCIKFLSHIKCLQAAPMLYVLIRTAAVFAYVFAPVYMSEVKFQKVCMLVQENSLPLFQRQRHRKAWDKLLVSKPIHCLLPMVTTVCYVYNHPAVMPTRFC